MNKEITHFADLKVNQNILRGIYNLGFENLSEVQRRVLPTLLEIPNKDTIIQAPSGSGKTATFGITLLNSLELENVNPQKLVLVPTRELAKQISNVIKQLGTYMEGLKIICLTGGTQVRGDIEKLKKGIHIVIGTPGRVFDMIERRKALKTESINTFVLDEADEMLYGNFVNQTKFIMKTLPTKTSIYLCSATITKDTEEISKMFMKNPFVFCLKPHEIVVKSILQYVLPLKIREKDETLIDLLQTITGNMVIFVNHQRRAEMVVERLRDRINTLNIACIHGKMESEHRSNVLDNLYNGALDVVVGTV